MVNTTYSTLSQEMITKALFETYEGIYDIDAETGEYVCCYESDAYRALQIPKWGKQFFDALRVNVPKVIHPADQEYVALMLRQDRVLAALKEEKYYSFVYRLLIEGEPTYHKMRATLEFTGGRPHILIGVRNVDETIRQEKLHSDTIASMFQKEKNHLEAILGSATGYMEVNLSKDIVLERSPNLLSWANESAPELSQKEHKEHKVYSYVSEWICKHKIVENGRQFARVSDRNNLLSCFACGDKRASVSFSLRRADNSVQPCREVFYLYQDDASGDVMAFCVVYDLTEQQRKEKELKELENALQMSRIRNFTSQMQPHFLYNALGSIQEVVLEDPQYASELIGDFTTHLRSCIRAMANDLPLPFSQELDNIRAYVNIEKMRLGKKLVVRYDIECQDFSILPLSIQPLVENAIRHGVYRRGVKGGTVIVRSWETDQNWFVEVEDDGVGFDAHAFFSENRAEKQDSTGLKNLVFRLSKVMNAQVDIQSVVDEGTKVRVTLPKGESDQ